MDVVGRDYRGRVVVLSAERWRHILDGHAVMAEHLDALAATIATPEIVNRDPARVHREVLYRRLRPGGRRFLKVVVHYRPVAPTEPDATASEWWGTVLTAYLTSRIKPGEERLWP